MSPVGGVIGLLNEFDVEVRGMLNLHVTWLLRKSEKGVEACEALLVLINRLFSKELFFLLLQPLKNELMVVPTGQMFRYSNISCNLCHDTLALGSVFA